MENSTKELTLIKHSSSLVLLAVFLFSTIFSSAQSIDQFQNHYSGDACWDANSKTITIESSGYLNFQGKNNPNSSSGGGLGFFIWNVPGTVEKIVIASCVTVNAAFHSEASLTVEGLDRRTSIIYGTEIKDWESNNGSVNLNNGKNDIHKYCAIQSFGGTLTVKNLTLLNTKGYAIRSWNKLLIAKDLNIIDTRGGSGNHSDGISGGDGTIIENCYFETGDDNIKVYNKNMTIKDCTFDMVENAVPIQLGWGGYSHGAVGNFSNIRIIGNSGRWSTGNAVISGGRNGNSLVTINIDGLYVDNPNAAMVDFMAPQHRLQGTITDAIISTNSYWGKLQAGGNKNNNSLKICNNLPPGGNPSPYHIDCRSNSNSTAGGSSVDSYTVPDCIQKTASGTINTIAPVNNTPNCITSDITDIDDLTLNQNGCDIVLNWTDVHGEDGYRIRRKISGEATFTNLGDVIAESEGYTDETTEEGLTYIYMVRPLVNGVAVKISNQPSITKQQCTITNNPEALAYKSTSAYPNPTSGLLNLNQIVHWKVYDLRGSLIAKGTSNRIDLTGFGDGVYLLKKEKRPMERIIKRH